MRRELRGLVGIGAMAFLVGCGSTGGAGNDDAATGTTSPGESGGGSEAPSSDGSAGTGEGGGADAVELPPRTGGPRPTPKPPPRVETGCTSDEECAGVVEPTGPCQEVVCLASSGACTLRPVADGTPCDDGVTCTAGDACHAGACTGQADAARCDDGDACTDDECTVAGCVHATNDACGPCEGLGCAPCGQGIACALQGPFLGDTCCAQGDSIEYLTKGTAAEAVDVETDGEYAYLCGGFGLRVNHLAAPDHIDAVGSIAPRCQRIAVGPLVGGRRTVYIAHHGDSWVEKPFLQAVRVEGPQGNFVGLQSVATLQEGPDVLYEGLLFDPQARVLYVAAHAGGLRIYTVDDEGVPSLAGTVGGLTNAWKLDLEGDTLFVADGEGGLRIFDATDPLGPVLVASVPAPGLARDVDAHGSRVYVATGGTGLAVYDASDPTSPQLLDIVDTQGSAQAVAVTDDFVAVAAWTHTAVYEPTTLALVGTETVKPHTTFEQHFGVAAQGDLIFVDEWEGLHVLRYHPGLVAPDIVLDQDLLNFGSDMVRAVVVRNRGAVDLHIVKVSVDPPGLFDVEDVAGTVVPPGKGIAFEVTFQPPPGGLHGPAQATLRIESDDPDADQNPYELPLVAASLANLLDVGDPLSPEFGFLDPTGAGKVENLQGHVVVLAYFALF